MQHRVSTADLTSLHEGLRDPPASARLVGVVRDPDPTIERVVDTNEPALGLPEPVREAIERRREDLMRRGMCESGAHNAAWEELDAENAYRRYLETRPAREALARVRATMADGTSLVLVCDGRPNLRSHRSVVRDELADE